VCACRGAGGAASPGVWGTVVGFQRVGKKDLGNGAAPGANGDDNDDDGLGKQRVLVLVYDL
jgi:hypothetical protein